MLEIKLHTLVGSFAENKDIARSIRRDKIIPELDANEEVVLDFEGVESATQSFIHALISDIIRKKGVESLNNIYFRKSCSKIPVKNNVSKTF